MEIPKSLYRTETVHRDLTADPLNGVLSCGFLVKPTDRYSYETQIFSHYGALILLSGSGLYTDPTGRQIPLKPGCFVQRMPGCPHVTQVHPDGKWLEFFVCFGRDYYEALAEQHLLSREPVLFREVTEPLVEQCRSLLEKFRTTPDFELFSLFLAVQEFALSLTQSALNKSMLLWEGRLSRAAKILCAAAPEYPSPAQAAAAVDMEYETFRKQFKAVYRCSPQSYQMRFRLNHAKELLIGTGKSVQEIAWACRFCDGFAFAKVFHRHFGLSPTAFRKKYR